jgi:D-tyrosyl-tRNA(Tyr) deacylase
VCQFGPVGKIAAMRALVQRVRSASVSVGEELIGHIEQPGLLVLVGVTGGDTLERADRLAAKVVNLRVLRNERSCLQDGAPLLVVSQFTLYADTRKGRRPGWSAAASAELAEPLVERFCTAIRGHGLPVQTGRFGADMAVASVNDGPVTLMLAEPYEPLPEARPE